MTAHEMQALVEELIAEFPPELRPGADNLAVFVAEEPDGETLAETGVESGTLLGLYLGRPLPERSVVDPYEFPDRITLFRRPILEEARESGVPVEQVVRETALHELAHVFGYTDEELDSLGLY